MTFPTMNPALTRALAARGYDTATAVQLAVLDDSAHDRDLVVSAQTGSGKTIAFGLALGATLLDSEEQLPAAASPLALIIAPTRELALQVCRELTWLYEGAGARVMTCVGGMDPRAEARQLEAGAHIVVGTPGRLRDHLERRRLDLVALRAVVLDEADEMLDLGFREDLEFILDATPAERRTLLFSATVPRTIEALAGRYQRNAVRLEIGRRDEQHADIEYLAHRLVPHDVENGVVNVLRFHEARAALVFCTTREAVGRLAARLLERGFSAVALSGELTQAERTQALQALRDGRARVLVATDVAARGLDLPDLDLVIHAELPNDGETLLHRSGRTGRAGRKGLCVLIVPYNRRRKADTLITAARLRVSWRAAPTPEEVRARDKDRFLADPAFVEPASGPEAQLVRDLQLAHPADQIALALVRLQRAKLPAPEELAVDTGPPPRRELPSQSHAGSERADRPRKPWPRDAARANGRGGGDVVAPESADARRHGPRAEAGSDEARIGNAHDKPVQQESAAEARRENRTPRPRRDDARPMTWFRINIGRKRNADPRWLLPLICRAGAVTKSEIGAIRVDELVTRFQILAEAADQFELHVRSAQVKEGHIVRADQDSGGAAATTPRAADMIAPRASEPAASKGAHRKPHKTGGNAGGARTAPWRDRSRPDAGAGGWSEKRSQGKPRGGHGPPGASGPGGFATSRQAPKYDKNEKKKKRRAPASAGSVS